MSNYVKLTALMLSLLMLAGCSGKNGDNSSLTALDGRIQDMETSADTVTEPEMIYLEAEDFGGRDFSIICGKAIGQNFPYEEVLAESVNGDILNDTVYERNTVLEEKYNIKIHAVQKENINSASDMFSSFVSAAEYSFQLGFISPNNSVLKALNGQLCKIDKLPYIEKDGSWWMKHVNDALSIKNTNYMLAGDMNIGMFNASSVMYFNKKLHKDYGVEDLYNAVSEGSWTLDKFNAVCRSVLSDVNGDSVYGDDDLIGYRCNTYSFQMFYNSFGPDSFIIKKDSGDLPYLDINEKNINMITSVVTMMNDTPYIQHPNFEVVSFPAYQNNLALFMTQPAYQLSQMRDIDVDFGMIPMPKYDESQKEYYSQVHTGWSSVTVVPITVPDSDIEFIAKITEDMARLSHETIRPAYYNVMIEGKYSRDVESLKMMDYIFGNIIVDLGMCLNGYKGFDFDTVTRNCSDQGTTDITSLFAEKEQMYRTVVESVIENWK